jgi:hypothetical protein
VVRIIKIGGSNIERYSRYHTQASNHGPLGRARRLSAIAKRDRRVVLQAWS